ncbi:MAG: TetR/AcrR family transcriptional regulator [Ilumatobacteraceae bacterium]
MKRDGRALILRAVLDLFEERANLTFTFEELARRAGVSRQTVYAHFPDRATLFVALADHTRSELDARTLTAAVYEAPTALDALTATVDFHMAYTMRILGPYRAIEIERARDPAVLAAFAGRDVGKLQTVRHVMTRLKAEGQLDQSWTIDAATDLVVALLSAAVSAELVEQKGWTLVELRERLLLTFRRTLLVSETHH